MINDIKFDEKPGACRNTGLKTGEVLMMHI